jgi:RimJ/RimL family protein N-acetyltransferase
MSRWLLANVPYAKPTSVALTLSVRRGTRLLGVVGVYNWQVGNVCYFGAAARDPRWFTRHVIHWVLETAFGAARAKRLVACTTPDNARTIKLLLRLGFRQTSYEKDGVIPGVDRVTYVLDKRSAAVLMQRIGGSSEFWSGRGQ